MCSRTWLAVKLVETGEEVSVRTSQIAMPWELDEDGGINGDDSFPSSSLKRKKLADIKPRKKKKESQILKNAPHQQGC